MAGSINKVILIGNVGKDPEVRSAGHSGNVANISLATSETWKDKSSGERKEKTEWHRVVVFGKLADLVQQYVSKGDKLYIEGKLQTRKWTDQNGQDKYSTEVVVSGFDGNMTFLSPPSSASSDRPSDPPKEPRERQDRADWRDDQPMVDDEIPF